MATSMKSFALLALIILLVSFKNPGSPDFIGSYGVSASDPAELKLTINADHTFYYQDFSNPKKKIAIKGSWIQKGNRVILVESDVVTSFHHVWRFTKNGQVANSRHGLAFYRLVKLAE